MHQDQPSYPEGDGDAQTAQERNGEKRAKASPATPKETETRKLHRRAMEKNAPRPAQLSRKETETHKLHRKTMERDAPRPAQLPRKETKTLVWMAPGNARPAPATLGATCCASPCACICDLRRNSTLLLVLLLSLIKKEAET